MACLSGLTTLQIGDEDGEFSGKSVAAFRFNRLFVSGRGTLATVETIVSVLHRWQGNHEHCRKKAQLLHLAGMEVQDIFEDLPDPGPVNAEEDDVFKVCLRKLDAHFRAEDNVPYERHVFRQLAPTPGETADKFMVRLRKQARHCNFGEALNENL